jgi:DNA processing protein
MEFPENLHLHAFNLLPQFGPVRLIKLAEYFKDFQQAYTASETELIKAGIEPENVQIFLQHRQKTNIHQEEEKLEKEGIKILTCKDQNYPRLLLEIPKFPPILYYRGRMEVPDELCVAIVGTRNISNYGRTVIPPLVEPLADAGITLVSGMAYGVDAAVHQIALNKGRRTIAVLGGGLDWKNIYPKHHALVAQKILDTGGALLSEYPIGTPNFKQNFVARNRIISGLSVATAIIECDLQSGTLITARHALDQNRNLYAVPGPIYSQTSQGPNNLIKMGAKPLVSANDILEDLNLKQLPEQQQNQSLFGDTAEEVRLLKILNHEPMGINEIIKQSSLDTGTVNSTLTFLEMKGKVRNLGGQQYILSR